MPDILGRARGHVVSAGTVREALDRDVLDSLRRDRESPPPLLLLPLRLEYRVVERDSPLRVAGHVAELFRGDETISVERSPPSDARSPAWRLDAASLRFRARREIWFRWFPDDDFSLRGIAPPTDAENAALLQFDSSTAGKPWHAVDDPVVISAWQALSRSVEPARAVHLLRHRSEPGDPNHLDSLGQMALLPEKVGLFALNAAGDISPIGEGTAIDPELRYSFAGLQAGGWLTDFNIAVSAGMGLRVSDPAAVTTALDAAWIIAAGISSSDGVPEVTALIGDAVANGTFEFLRQDTPTNNTPHEPTPFRAPRTDLAGFLRTAADAERGVLASPLTQSAELLAEALGIDVSHVANAPGSGDLAFEDARAMVRVIGPALIDTAQDHIAALQGIDESEIIDLFAEAAVARGPLPAVRFGKNPYGILPVVKLDGLADLASDTDRQKRIEAFVRNFALLIGNDSQVAAESVPVVEPGDREASEKLEAVLKLNPVSRRLEVRTVLSNDAKPLGCAYVTNQEHPVATYLADLSRMRIVDLPDPTHEDASWPLLYRLARLSLSKSTILTGVRADLVSAATLSLRVHLTEVEERTIDIQSRAIAAESLASLAVRRPVGIGRGADALTFASGRFLAALRRLEAIALEPDGAAKLETLLMETIDLFQHRIDAWATGIAYRRLLKRRRAGRTGLTGGYWGMLGKLRPTSVTGRTDGYLQAPSPHQAATAAVLRSAHLRHSGSGAFAIGLDSARVRRGMTLLEMLQAGLSPSETLGYLAERKLHDRHQDVLVFRLRDLFPLRDPRDDSAVQVRLHDGFAFLASDVATLVGPAEVAILREVQTELRQDFDSLADIVIAEATHLRAMGQADAANAWLQVLSGETIPGKPTILHTRRNGHGSSHRIVVLLDTPDSNSGNSPRSIAEPALAALAASRLSGFDTAFVTVGIGNEPGMPPTTVQFTLADDLGLEPIDLLVGGESEIVLRARHRTISLWQNDSDLRELLGPLPDRDVVSYVNSTRPITVELGTGQPGVRDLLTIAGDLRRVVAQGRMIEPGDLSAASDPAARLTDGVERDILSASSAVLRGRVTALASKLSGDAASLRAAIGPTVAAARNYRRMVDEQSDTAAIVSALAQLESARASLDAALVRVSHYAEPGALRPVGLLEITSEPDDFERSLLSIEANLARKSALLSSASAVTSLPANATVARAERGSLVAALRSVLDGDALPILPPVVRTSATTPLLDSQTSSVASALTEWQSVRAKVARVAAHFGDELWSAYSVSPAATAADDAEADARSDESVAPRSHFFGTFVSSSDPSAAESFTGFAADEWAEQRPSRMQQTGVAINYDSPQSEPPHVILLCEPSGPGAASWSSHGAAEMVATTIRLMKSRALSAQTGPVPGPLLPFANQVPFKQMQPAGSLPRIPVREWRFISTAVAAADMAFVVSAGEPDVGVAGSGLNEITGFGKVKE